MSPAERHYKAMVKATERWAEQLEKTLCAAHDDYQRRLLTDKQLDTLCEVLAQASKVVEWVKGT